MTITQIRSVVNARLADLWPKFMVKEEAYRAAHGTYAQLLPLSAVPGDGALVSPDGNLAPSDRPLSTANLLLAADLPASLEAQFQCDVYGHGVRGAPGEQGYRLTCRVSKSGVTYARTAWVHDGVEQTTGAWTNGA